MTNRTERYIVVAAAILVLLYSMPRGGTAEGANVTPGVSHPVLDKLTEILDSMKIDVRMAWDKSTPSGRPTLAPLNGFPAQVPQVTHGEFAEGFRTGASGTVLAIQPASKRSLDVNDSEQKLLSDWISVPAEQRVFVSFARPNLSAATAVQNALRRTGYRAFIYINTPGQTPALTPEKTGTYFSTAGHHFVIDSHEARTSPAVAYEAHWVTLLSSQPPPSLPSKNNAGGPAASHNSNLNGPALQTCWECCRYVNHVKTGCVFVGCGEEAHQRVLKTCHGP